MQSPSIAIEDALKNGNLNKLAIEDRTAHDWYRFVLSYPPHLVRAYIQRFGMMPGNTVLDPFCGTGTTLVECKKLGINSVGIEAHPMSHFASSVKVDWTPDATKLLKHSARIADSTNRELEHAGLSDHPNGRRYRQTLLQLEPEAEALLLTNSISPLPLHKTLALLAEIDRMGSTLFRNHQRLAIAKALVYSISNLHFGPEVGVGPPKSDVAVIASWLLGIQSVADDLQVLSRITGAHSGVHLADSRQPLAMLKPKSIDAVITSPPYPNEKDYTRTTRLESVLLGFIRRKADLKALKQSLMRSNTRNVYKQDLDDEWVAEHERIQGIADAIEERRIELGKTSGFERLYARVTKLYFGGMAQHLSNLRKVLRPGAQLAYVVGDQASYLRVMIRTGQILADIAQSLGYEVVGIDLFRTRLATATREQLREEVVVLRWPGRRLRRTSQFNLSS